MSMSVISLTVFLYLLHGGSYAMFLQQWLLKKMLLLGITSA